MNIARSTRRAALPVALALTISSLTAPVSHAATVSAPNASGVCKASFTDAEKKAIADIQRQGYVLGLGIEDEFRPGVKAIADEYINEPPVKAALQDADRQNDEIAKTAEAYEQKLQDTFNLYKHQAQEILALAVLTRSIDELVYDTLDSFEVEAVTGAELTDLQKAINKQYSTAEMLTFLIKERPDPDSYDEELVRRFDATEKIFKRNPSFVRDEFELQLAHAKLTLACSTGGGEVKIPNVTAGLNPGGTTTTPKPPKTTTPQTPGTTGPTTSQKPTTTTAPNAPTTTATPQTADGGSELEPAAIAGIVIGVLAAIALAIGAFVNFAPSLGITLPF